MIVAAQINDIVHNTEQAASIIEHDANQVEFSCLKDYEEMVRACGGII